MTAPTDRANPGAMDLWTLAMEGGSTGSRFGLYSPEGTLAGEWDGPPANPAAYGPGAPVDAAIQAVSALDAGNRPLRILAGIAGLATQRQRTLTARALREALSAHFVAATTDLHPLLMAACGAGDGMLAIAGTGSAVLARNRWGKVLRAGGRGPLLGDEGSAWRLAVEALRAACAWQDGTGPETLLSERLLEILGARWVDELVEWAAVADKRTVASLAPIVTECAHAGDFVARGIVEDQARRLAALTVSCAEKLGLNDGVRCFTHGGVFARSPLFLEAFRENVHQYLDAQFMPCPLTGHRAVFEAMRQMEKETPWAVVLDETSKGGEISDPVTRSSSLPPTEQPREETPLDELTPLELVRRLNRLDHAVAPAVGRQESALARLVEQAAKAIRAGHRIIYAGAGTSGRLAALDAAECPPTFGVSPQQVVALMAGGEQAFTRSVENAEDDAAAGATDLSALDPVAGDVVIGVAASGNTPYVRGVLDQARALGLYTALLTSNPHPAIMADLVISFDTGPEALPGSTRLKAGTAAKMALNIVSTGAMTLAGYVYRGRMVRVIPSNEKLRDRAVRIVAELCGVPYQHARQTLESAGWNVPVAIVMLERNLENPADAASMLDAAGGRIRDALRHREGNDPRL
ncbi:MAG TPA: N-acetylmuramic acid 6-phosphate etherase [Candidatus Hydrogenedentes bacterium]|nr:N-acetylmuramic acid 6-phosphate etherase [Candidatus Hydrogenedentota bacterium]HOV60061.1 N-acetylmuramic acid 6-phosphate etherase [Candidatus Hydrogenedentota bacterium]